MVWQHPPGNATLAPHAQIEHSLESLEGTHMIILAVKNNWHTFFPGPNEVYPN